MLSRNSNNAAKAVWYALPLCLVLIAAGTAVAHPDATGIVKDRMDAMQSIAAAMKRTSGLIRAASGSGETGTSAIAVEARKIAAHGNRIPVLFPAGSDGGVSDATPEIWTNADGFAQKSADMIAAANDLAAAAEAARAGELAAKFRGLGATCSACHRDFRQKRTRH